MNDDDRKALGGCIGAFIALANTAMIGVIFIYAITHW